MSSQNKLPILCLDFDGVIHGYQSGWQGPAIIPDPPVPGAIQFLHGAVERFQVAVYSSRSGQPGGIDAMRGWLMMWLMAIIDDRREAEHVLGLILWPTEKPAAIVTIDDRALTFTGQWPSLDEIAAFQPWNKRPTPAAPAILSGASKPELPTLLARLEQHRERLFEEHESGSGYRFGDNGRPLLSLTNAEARAILSGADPAVGGEAKLSQAARDVLAERRRQVEAEGWTPEHDDRHRQGEIARAAAAYAHAAGWCEDNRKLEAVPPTWPWDAAWWKSTTRRRDLVKSAALAIADIERLDRATPPTPGGVR